MDFFILYLLFIPAKKKEHLNIEAKHSLITFCHASLVYESVMTDHILMFI